MREGLGLYRGKRVDNGQWIEGYYVKTTTYRGDEFIDHLIIPYDSDSCVLMAMFESVDPETVGQYTGEESDDGIKVCEGDKITGFSFGVISNSDVEYFVIGYEKGCFIAIPIIDGEEILNMAAPLNAILIEKVIGNIHDQ